MTTFIDGPAKGKNLMLKSAPRLLRVTESNGKWDALNCLADIPREDETLYLYERVGEAAVCHIRASGGRSGFYSIASYRLAAKQPTDKELRAGNWWSQIGD